MEFDQDRGIFDGRHPNRVEKHIFGSFGIDDHQLTARFLGGEFGLKILGTAKSFHSNAIQYAVAARDFAKQPGTLRHGFIGNRFFGNSGKENTNRVVSLGGPDVDHQVERFGMVCLEHGVQFSFITPQKFGWKATSMCIPNVLHPLERSRHDLQSGTLDNSRWAIPIGVKRQGIALVRRLDSLLRNFPKNTPQHSRAFDHRDGVAADGFAATDVADLFARLGFDIHRVESQLE